MEGINVYNVGRDPSAGRDSCLGIGSSTLAEADPSSRSLEPVLRYYNTLVNISNILSYSQSLNMQYSFTALTIASLASLALAGPYDVTVTVHSTVTAYDQGVCASALSSELFGYSGMPGKLATATAAAPQGKQ